MNHSCCYCGREITQDDEYFFEDYYGELFVCPECGEDFYMHDRLYGEYSIIDPNECGTWDGDAYEGTIYRRVDIDEQYKKAH